MFGTFVVAMTILISYAGASPRDPYFDFFSSMSDGPVLDSNNDPALAGIDNNSTPAPQQGVSTTLFPEDLPTYSPDASKSMQANRQRDHSATGSMSEHPRESLPATESKGQFSLMDVNTWDSIPTAFFEPAAPSVTRGNKPGAPNQGDSWQNPITYSEAGAEPSLSWDYSSAGMGGGADIGGGGTQDVALPLADHSPGSMQADQPIMGIDWSAPPVSKDTAKYREEPTPKPVTFRFSDGESMARAILSGQVKKWEWTYSTTLRAGSSSGQGDRYDKSLTCCQRLPYICGVDGMCVIGIDECQEFCTCAANPHMPHCQKIIPIIKRTMAALERKILAKVARDLTFTTTTTTTTTTTARAQINRKPAAGDFIPRITHSGQFTILGEQSAARVMHTLNPTESRSSAEATRKPAVATRFQPSAVPRNMDSVVHFQSTQGVQNMRNLSDQKSQKQPSVNTKTTVPAGAISDFETNLRNQNVLSATLGRRYSQITVTESPKSVKTLLTSSPANIMATQFHPTSLSKNGLASGDWATSTQAPTIGINKHQTPTQAPTTGMRKPQTPTQAPTTGMRKPQTPTQAPTVGMHKHETPNQAPTNGIPKPQTQTAAGIKPKTSPRNSKLPFTVDPDSVPITKTTLLSPSSINPPKARANTSPSDGLSGNLKQNHITNSNSMPSITYTVGDKGFRTNGTSVNTHTVGLNDSNANTTDIRSTLHSKENKHTSPGDNLVAIGLNTTRQRVETDRLNNITRTSNVDRDTTATRRLSDTTTGTFDINTGEELPFMIRDDVSTSRPDITTTTMVTNKPNIPIMHVGGYNPTGNDSTVNDPTVNGPTANDSIGNDSIKSASKETMSSTLSGRIASVRPSTTTASVERASIPNSNIDRPAISRTHVDGFDSTVNDSTGNVSTVNDSTGNVSTVNYSTVNYSTVNDSTANDSTVNDSTVNDSTVNDSTGNVSTVNVSVKSSSKEATSSTLSGITSSVRPGTTSTSIEKAYIPNTNSDMPAISRMQIDSYDSTGNDSTMNDSIGNDSVTSASKEAINSTLPNRIASVRPSTTTASMEKASISVSNRDNPAISRMHVNGKDSTGNDFTDSDSTGNDSVKSSSNKATISTLNSRVTSIRTSTAAGSINKKTISVTNGEKLTISRMSAGGNDSTDSDPSGNDTVKATSYKELLGSTTNTESENHTSAVGNRSFKSKTMPTAKISNISREATELAGPNNGSDGMSTFLSFMGNVLRYNEPLTSTGRETGLTTSSELETTASTSNIISENTTPIYIDSTSVADQTASVFIHQFTTNSPVTYDDAAVSDHHRLNDTTDISTPNSKAIEEIQLVANPLSTLEPPQDGSTDYLHGRINDEDGDPMKYTSTSPNNYTIRKTNETNGLFATDKGSLENNITTGSLNDKETILKNNMNHLNHKDTTQTPSNTSENADSSSIGVYLPGTTEPPTKDEVHNDSGKSSINVTSTIVNGSFLEFDPAMTTATSNGSEIKPCSAQCQGDGGVCILGDDLKSHCVIVSEVCHQHRCVNGYCVSSDGKPSCECHRGWFGASCDTPCPVDCSDRSFCQGVSDNDIIMCTCRWNYTGYDCSSTRKVLQLTPEVVFPSRDLETWEVAIVAVVTAVVAALLCVVSPYLLWKNQWLPMRQLCFFFLPYEDEDEKYFDAFISYQASPRDERFVTQHLIPRLEKEFDMRLCLPTRDFVPGETTSSNNIRAVKGSRRTMLILSPAYVSEWSKDEYFKVKQEILKLKDKVIPVVLEDFADLQKVDPFFRRFIDSAYSVKWPGEGISRSSSSISKFWKLLELSMPKKRNKSNSSVSSSELYSSDASLSSCSKTRFSSNTSSIYEEIIYSPTLVGPNKGSDDGNIGQKTMHTRKPIYSLIGNSSFPDLSWYHQGRLPASSLPSPQESRSISSLSDDTGIETTTRSSSISSGLRVSPDHVVNIQGRIPRVRSVLGPVPRGQY